MIILQMSGGLGNQMFQYAMYLKLKKLGKEVKFDDVATYSLDNARPIQLAVFDISYPRATKEEITIMRDSSPALKDKIRRKLKGRKLKQYIENNYCYDKDIYELDDTYLIGYFQSEKYFEDIRDQVKKAFVFRQDLITDMTAEIQKEVESHENSVSIHVRRGDYLSGNGEDLYSDICTDDYYSGSIDYILEKYENAVFYLFTNDQIWADFFINIHPNADIRVVRGNTEYTGYLDLYLMSRCRHHIVANSSFSWWGAWISPLEGETIAPAKWLNNDYCSDINTKDMVKINPAGEVVK